MTGTEAEAGPSSPKLAPALNEEGLPFVDLNEPASEQGDTRLGRGVVLPFRPTNRSKEERRAWLEATLREVESEEKHASSQGVVRPLQGTVTANESQASRHARVASADRPAPIRSVLKHTSSGSSTPQRFGASGMRKGFLNMNPSSPAAEHSSDPIDKILWGADEPMSASTSSLGSAGEYMRGNASGTDDGRSSRDAQQASEALKLRKKKTVRIQSPERRRDESQSMRSQLARPSRQAVNIQREEEDSNKDEARMIVDLLGIDAIKGHPQYESIKSSMEQEEAARMRPAAQAPPPTNKRKTPEEPAVRKSVVEREPPSAAQVDPTASRVIGQRKRFVPPGIPTNPQLSQGVSALERATRNDGALAQQRAKQGLKPSVPHARPSKAFAAKLNARKQQGDKDAMVDDTHDDDETPPNKASKVRFGEDDTGKLAVSVGVAATVATGDGRLAGEGASSSAQGGGEGEDESSGDELMAAMGLDVRDDVLDEEEVEALGYFSEEDMDPDIGFDSDDLVDAYPRFDSESATIDNDELRREYERVKASLNESNRLNPEALRFGRNREMEMQGGEDHDISLADDESDSLDTKASRFKRERLYRLMMDKPASSNELGASSRMNKKSGVHNAGPSMILPSLLDVRYPKTMADGSVPTSANEIELDGESDEDADRLEDVMRSRLADLDLGLERSDVGSEVANDRTDAPPRVMESNSMPDPPPNAKKKTSLFKSRMQGTAVD